MFFWNTPYINLSFRSETPIATLSYVGITEKSLTSHDRMLRMIGTDDGRSPTYVIVFPPNHRVLSTVPLQLASWSPFALGVIEY